MKRPPNFLAQMGGEKPPDVGWGVEMEADGKPVLISVHGCDLGKFLADLRKLRQKFPGCPIKPLGVNIGVTSP